MDPLVYVRLEVEGMRYQINHSFSTHQLQIAQMVDEKIKDAFNNFNMADIVTQEMNRLIPELVRTEIRNRVEKALWSNDVRQFIDRTVEQGIANFFEEKKNREKENE